MWAGRTGEHWRLRETDTSHSPALLASALGLSAADVSTRAERLSAGLPGALEGTVNSLTVDEQDTIENVDLVAQVVARSGRCAAAASELRREIRMGLPATPTTPASDTTSTTPGT